MGRGRVEVGNTYFERSYEISKIKIRFQRASLSTGAAHLASRFTVGLPVLGCAKHDFFDNIQMYDCGVDLELFANSKEFDFGDIFNFAAECHED
jgi:hypothetical protein